MDVAETRVDWPVPAQEVLGTRGGAMAWIEYQLVRGITGAAARLPAGLRSRFVGGLARLARRFDRSHSRSAEVFLLQALGEMPRAELQQRVLQSWKHLIEVSLDTEVFEQRVLAADVRSHFEVELCPEARALLDQKQGCVIVTGHIGNWECALAILPRLGFDPLYAVGKPPRNRWLSAHIQRLRESHGMRLLPRRGSMEFVPTIVRAGGTVALLLDQRARVKPVMAPFFGRLAPCDRSASVLLRRIRAPLVFAACYRTDRPLHFRFVAPRVVRPEEVEGKSAEEIAALVNSELEKLILAAPEQYFWLHDRWRS